MKLSLIVKLNFLVLGLLLVLFSIFKIKKSGLPEGLFNFSTNSGSSQVLLSSPTQTPFFPQKQERICKTRVQSIYLDWLQITYYQKRWDWIKKEKGEEQIIAPVAMEKWFARNCFIVASVLRDYRVQEMRNSGALKNFQKKLILEFIKGDSEALLLDFKGHFYWRKKYFKSLQLYKALSELE